MKKLFTIFLLFTFLSGFSQEVKPTGTNFKILQSPSFGYNTADSIPWMYKSSLYGWNSLATIKRLNHSLDSLKRTISGGTTPIDDILHWSTNKYTPFSAKKITDPGYAYFYNSSDMPTYQNLLKLDGNLYATAFLSSSQDGTYSSNFDQYSFTNTFQNGSDTYTSGIYNGMNQQIVSHNDVNDYFISGFYWYGPNIKKAIIQSTRDFTTPMPLIIDASDLTIAQGTANKWLSLDSNKKIVYNDAPSGRAIFASNGAYLSGDTVKLGGILTDTTTISTGNNPIEISNPTAGLHMEPNYLQLWGNNAGGVNSNAILNDGFTVNVQGPSSTYSHILLDQNVGAIGYSNYLDYANVYYSEFSTRKDSVLIHAQKKNNRAEVAISSKQIMTSFTPYEYVVPSPTYIGTIQDSTGIRYTRIPESSFQDSTLVTKHYINKKVIAGSVSVSTTSTSSLTVTIGQTMDNTTYKVCVTPTSAIAAVPFYVTSKSTTQFLVTYLTPSTGYVSFDWILTP